MMLSTTDLIFRAANFTDIPSIKELHNSLVWHQQSNYSQGFLLKETAESIITQQLQSLDHQYYLTWSSSLEKIIGFLVISQPRVPQSFFKKINCQDPIIQQQILSDKHIYIEIIVVKPEFFGQGIGQFMYASLEQKFPDSCFSAFIVNQPICNQRSLKFHRQQGFQVIGKLHHDQFLGLKNYESLLMFKKSGS